MLDFDCHWCHCHCQCLSLILELLFDVECSHQVFCLYAERTDSVTQPSRICRAPPSTPYISTIEHMHPYYKTLFNSFALWWTVTKNDEISEGSFAQWTNGYKQTTKPFTERSIVLTVVKFFFGGEILSQSRDLQQISWLRIPTQRALPGRTKPYKLRAVGSDWVSGKDWCSAVFLFVIYATQCTAFI